MFTSNFGFYFKGEALVCEGEGLSVGYLINGGILTVGGSQNKFYGSVQYSHSDFITGNKKTFDCT